MPPAFSSRLRSKLLEQDLHLREVILGSGLALLVKVLAAGSAFLMNIVIARTLGAAEAGLFFLAFTLVGLGASVGQMGLNNTLVRFIASSCSTGDGARLHAVYRKAMFWAGMLGMLICIVILLGNNLLKSHIFNQLGFEKVLWVAGFAVPVVGLYILHAQALQGLQQVVKSMTVLNVVVPVLLLTSVLLLPVTSAVDVVWLYLSAAVVALALGRVWWTSCAPKQVEEGSVPNSVLLNSCLPLWGVAVLSQLISWFAQLYLGAVGTTEEVALFAVAQRTAMLTSFVLVAVNAITAPKFAAMFAQGDMRGVRKVALWSVRLMLIAAAPALVLMLLVPEWLMGFFGTEFREAATALMILALGQFVNVATGSVGYLLSMTGHERALRLNFVIGAILAVGLSLLLIPVFGLVGGALATSVAIAMQNLAGVYQVKRKLGFNTLAFWQKV